ncbi:SMP-30/gluconolactonase/LRE family protein [Nocardioides sp.]|uniref:SMP-30/gluconolactonase/LRE family protein n=1 Tax=Nocardioides sp. TaxID=35761 RepID=UPI002725A119|nr:SMP-30/gluconolactonase/LRE family protein [Nocardioides sp.]MDO9454682.1 SMP-30/gluconolactonase/LRE family protein [Nocardioides sp.]
MSPLRGAGLPGMTELSVFATGIQMGESPRWHDGRFWMCDWMAGEVLVFAADGTREVVARVDGLPFSIDWLPDGRLVLSTPDGVCLGPELAPYGLGERGWNEIVVDPAGRAYVDVPGSMPWEEPVAGVAGVVLPDGSSRVVAGDLWFPNGMAVTPDGTTLVVAESHADRLTAFTIADDGDLVDRRVWADLGKGAAPDGICLDREGAVWFASVPGRHCRRVAEGGEVLETVDTGQPAFSCVLGDDDGRTLYVVANDFDGHGASNGRVLTSRVAVAGW